MRKKSLAQISNYYTLCEVEGKPLASSWKEAFGTSYNSEQNLALRASEDWQVVASAVKKANMAIIERDITELKKKKLKAYSRLIDQGSELLEKAGDDTDLLLKAQKNQRENLSLSVVEDANSWDSETRNQNDYGDILEGIIV